MCAFTSSKSGDLSRLIAFIKGREEKAREREREKDNEDRVNGDDGRDSGNLQRRQLIFHKVELFCSSLSPSLVDIVSRVKSFSVNLTLFRQPGRTTDGFEKEEEEE